MAVVDGSQKRGLDGAEGHRVKILGKFPFDNILAEDDVLLVWVGECW